MTRRIAAVVVATVLGAAQMLGAGGHESIAAGDLKTWLTYVASDQLEGRAAFTEGLGRTASYLQGHLREWGVSPGGDRGTYLQAVRVVGIRAKSKSSVTVRVGNQSRTFTDGEGVTFPRNAGGRQAFTADQVQFVGYGLEAPAANHRDFQGRNVEGAAVVFLGADGPKSIDGTKYRRLLTGRSRVATDSLRAIATLGPPPAQEAAAAGSVAGAVPSRPGNADAPDFTTTQALDQPVPPAARGSDALFEFLFSQAPVRYDELRRRVADRDALPSFRLEGVSITFNVDVEYTVVRTQMTTNVVGIVEGSDPQARSTYVAYGAHYDHVGYAEGELTADGARPAPPGRVTPGTASDRVWNGADDDGSGTVALMAIARAFAQGPRPKRSLLFVWHAGEERGLLGSRYFADHPSVPIDGVLAQLNLDMIGRNRDDLPSEGNTVYLVGSDRISSQLHHINRDANASLSAPLTLDYEMNDPSDLEQLYYRSDHYSYAAKGIPVIFFTTGLHPDYHANTDEVSKIEFAKLARITQLAYETGRRVANLDRPLVRDRLGPRAGKGTP